MTGRLCSPAGVFTFMLQTLPYAPGYTLNTLPMVHLSQVALLSARTTRSLTSMFCISLSDPLTMAMVWLPLDDMTSSPACGGKRRAKCSLRSKRSRTKRPKFGPCVHVLVFQIRDTRKRGRERKDGRKGLGEGKEGNACPQPLDFEKPVRPRTGLLIGAAWSS